MPRYTKPSLCDFSGDLSKQWYIYYSVQDPSTGRMVRFKFSKGLNSLKTIKERRAYAAMVMREISLRLSQGWNPLYKENERREEKGVLKDTVSGFLSIKKSTLRKRSHQSYLYAWHGFERWLTKNHPEVFFIQDLSGLVARSYIDHLSGQGYSGKTINLNRDFLYGLFQMAVEREMISKNPFKGIAAVPESGNKNRAFTREEMEKIWSEVTHGQKVFTRMIFYCYIRPIEILRLKVGDVNLKDGVIIISGDQSKNRKTQSVVIPQAYAQELSDYIGGASSDFYLFGFKWKPCGKPMSRNHVSLKLNAVIHGLGFGSDYTLYSFKHSGVVAAYQAGIDLYSISRQLRHHSLVITQIYLKSLGLMPNTEFASKMK